MQHGIFPLWEDGHSLGKEVTKELLIYAVLFQREKSSGTKPLFQTKNQKTKNQKKNPTVI